MATTYEPIQTYTAGANVTTITFSAISQAYTDLKIVMSARRATGFANVLPVFTFNGNTSSIYSGNTLYSSSTATNPYQSTVTTRFYLWPNGTDQNNTITYEIDVMNYTSSTKAKSILQNTSAKLVTGGGKGISVGLFNSTTAITSVTFSDVFGDGFGSNTTITIYGIKAA